MLANFPISFFNRRDHTRQDDCLALCNRASIANMLNAYVGIVSVHGLRTIYVEHVGSMKRVRTLAATSKCSVGFWAVIPESEAQVVRFLLDEGEQDSALRYLSRTARDIGRILPLHQ